jgi:hypothetical protein
MEGTFAPLSTAQLGSLSGIAWWLELLLRMDEEDGP